ncbi:MAG: nitroreductase [Armatimonadetes bacterium]|nr:nitroreductase [Armatimonadota bacterium]NIM23111.1 nitroreductase [Armatimonadota bacterium]NIM66979.1 nitroreductase [Armatimonadota bacterium]NIM75513.1 nitroreductase [Armatimonadota bacterium]NIN05168.1 nitroreductase [Armatimonadota bacterium]
MDFYALVNARYSIRSYKTEPVPEEIIRRILGAARLAPSAANMQPWHFFVVRDEKTRRGLFSNERQAWAAAAPVVLVACSYPDKAWVRSGDGKNHSDVDIAIAMEHIVLAATEEGLGTCWICAFDPALVRSALGLPGEMEPVAMTPLGYAEAEPLPRKRKSLDEIVTWR